MGDMALPIYFELYTKHSIRRKPGFSAGCIRALLFYLTDSLVSLQHKDVVAIG